MALRVAERKFIQRIVLEDAWGDKPALVAAWREFGLAGDDLGDGGVLRAIDRFMQRPDARGFRATATQRYDIFVRHQARQEEGAHLTLEQLSEEARCEGLEAVMEALDAQRKALKASADSADGDLISAAQMSALAQLAKIAMSAPSQGGGGIPDDAEAKSAERRQKEIARTAELARQARDGARPDESTPESQPEPVQSEVRLPVFDLSVPKGRA